MNGGVYAKCKSIALRPVGSECNLHCLNCVYKQNQDIEQNSHTVMNETVLERVISEAYRFKDKSEPVSFSWVGGEPTMCGLPFYERVVEIQKSYGRRRPTINTFLTNGFLIDDDWCRFFSENNFVVGISVDGPKELHDKIRVAENNISVYDHMMTAIELFQKYKVNYNAMVLVSKNNVKQPLTVYRFVRELSNYIQFIAVTKGEEKVVPMDYGNFLSKILIEWYKNDENSVYIQAIESVINNFEGCHSGYCYHDAICGTSPVVLQNGDMYACDSDICPDTYLGNIMENDLETLLIKSMEFGKHKVGNLTAKCMQCRYFKLCYGGCQKDRYENPQTGVYENYLCDGYRHFFETFEDLKQVDMTNHISYLY